MSTPNFNFIAPFYDLLVRIFFGRSLQIAQQFHLKKIKPEDKVLILGGGTGQVLYWLPASCEVTFLDVSEVMIKKAKKKGKAHFIQADFIDYSMDQKFDWIVCSFFLDCFDVKVLNAVLDKIYKMIETKGSLIITDFIISNTRQKWFSRSMVWGFQWVANLQANKLHPIQKIVRNAGFILNDDHIFLRGFVFSDIYKK